MVEHHSGVENGKGENGSLFSKAESQKQSYNVFDFKKQKSIKISKDEENRERILKDLLPIFKSTNIGCFLLIAAFGVSDFVLSLVSQTHAAIVAEKLLIAIVAATAAQLGSMMFAIGKYYFNSKGNSSE